MSYADHEPEHSHDHSTQCAWCLEPWPCQEMKTVIEAFRTSIMQARLVAHLTGKSGADRAGIDWALDLIADMAAELEKGDNAAC